MPPVRDDLESGEYGLLNGADTDSAGGSPQQAPIRSIYALTRAEITKGLANRFVHSRAYVWLYLGMAALSATTVVLSLREQCPGVAFYVLELVINGAMIAEVGVRLVAFGRKFWQSAFNVFDVVVTFFCSLTLIVLAFARCGAASKEEELFDTLLLIARNVLQFSRLATVMRQSGHSIFSAPKPIDLSAARRAGFALDVDYAEDEALYADAASAAPLVPSSSADGESLLFDADGGRGPTRGGHARSASRQRAGVGATSEMPRAVEAAQNRDDEDVWAELG